MGGGSGQGQSGPGKGQQKIAGNVLDDHSKLNDADTSNLADQVAKRLSEEEREEFNQKLGKEGKECQQAAGQEAGGFVKAMDKQRVPKKRKWETLIKHYLKTLVAEDFHETWVQPNRRMMATNGSGGHSDIILPAEVMSEGKEKKRALVYMFLDTSGSCAHLADRFWRLAKSVPQDVFDLRMRCFDTQVYEVNLKDRQLYGFGGTSFGSIEKPGLS